MPGRGRGRISSHHSMDIAPHPLHAPATMPPLPPERNSSVNAVRKSVSMAAVSRARKSMHNKVRAAAMASHKRARSSVKSADMKAIARSSNARDLQLREELRAAEAELATVTERVEKLRRAVGGDEVKTVTATAYVEVESEKEEKLVRNHRVLRHGIMLFNRSGKKGIKFLQEQRYLSRSPKKVAQFIRRTRGLSKPEVGEYFSKALRKEYNAKVFAAYVAEEQFKHFPIVDAIRKYFTGFDPPGESGPMDFLLLGFAKEYMKQNRGLPHVLGLTTDMVHFLCYALMMLNTDLHNPNNTRSHMTLRQFKRQFPEEWEDKPGQLSPSFGPLISSIYHTLKVDPLKFVSGTTERVQLMYPTCKGWGHKVYTHGWKNGKTKKKWFMVSDGVLYYFDHRSSPVPDGALLLHGCSIDEPKIHDANDDGPARIVIRHASGGPIVKLDAIKWIDYFEMETASQAEATMWREHILAEAIPASGA